MSAFGRKRTLYQICLDENGRQKNTKKVIHRTWGKRGALTGFPTFWRLRAGYKTTS